MYHLVPIYNHTLLCTWNLLRVAHNGAHQVKQKCNYGGDGYVSLIVVVISRCICLWKYHIMHLKYTQLLFFIYTSMKAGEKRNKEKYVGP